MTPRQLLKRLVPPTPRWPQPPEQPDLGELFLQERLTPLVEALAHPDEPRRRAAVEHVVRTCIPALVARLIDRLVDLLDGDGTARSQALASLAQFGGRALPTLTLRFERTPSSTIQRGIVEALTRMATGFKPAERVDLMIEVLALERFAADAPVKRELAGLVAVARTASEAPSRTR
jgi:HEAT repeat protein